MSPKQLTAFRIAPEVMEGLRAVKDRDLIPMSIQVDQALRAWLKLRGIQLERTARKRASTRKRSKTDQRR